MEPRIDQTLLPREQRSPNSARNEIILHGSAAIGILFVLYLLLVNSDYFDRFKMIQPLADIKTYE